MYNKIERNAVTNKNKDVPLMTVQRSRTNQIFVYTRTNIRTTYEHDELNDFITITLQQHIISENSQNCLDVIAYTSRYVTQRVF